MIGQNLNDNKEGQRLVTKEQQFGVFYFFEYLIGFFFTYLFCLLQVHTKANSSIFMKYEHVLASHAGSEVELKWRILGNHNGKKAINSWFLQFVIFLGLRNISELPWH